MNIKQGEVWLADLGIAAKTRPVVIVSRYDANPPRVLVIYSKTRSNPPQEGSQGEAPQRVLYFNLWRV